MSSPGSNPMVSEKFQSMVLWSAFNKHNRKHNFRNFWSVRMIVSTPSMRSFNAWKFACCTVTLSTKTSLIPTATGRRPMHDVEQSVAYYRKSPSYVHYPCIYGFRFESFILNNFGNVWKNLFLPFRNTLYKFLNWSIMFQFWLPHWPTRTKII